MLSVLFYACSTTKKVPEGEYLLTKNKFKYTDKKLFSSNIPNFVSQSPNSKNIFGLPMGLIFYNSANPDYDAILNEYMSFPSNMRNQKLRDSLAIKYDRPEFVGRGMTWSRMMHTFGKAPVILDATKTQQSANAIKKYLGYRGYWDSQVSYEIKRDSTAKKAENIFSITYNEPTYISQYDYHIPYDNIREIYDRNIHKSHIKAGQILDQANIEEEVKRINSLMRNAGYYDFNASNEEVFFTADTLQSRKQVPLKLEIEKDTLKTPYKKHSIGKIEVFIKNNISDSIQIEEQIGDVLINKTDDRFKGKTIWRAIALNTGKTYNQNHIELSRRNLIALNNFSIVNANPLSKKTPNDSVLDVRYTLIPLKKYELKLATDVHYSQILNFGFSPSLEFTSRNVFRGGENFGASISGIIGSTKNPENKVFNAYEFSGEISLKFPRFLLPFNTDKIVPRTYAPSSLINLGASVQNNIGLGRINFNAGIHYYLNVNDVVSHQLSLLNTQLSLTRNKDNYYNLFPNDKAIRNHFFKLYEAFNFKLVNAYYQGLLPSDDVSEEIINNPSFLHSLSPDDKDKMNLFIQSLYNKDRQTQDVLISSLNYNFLYNELGKKQFRNPFYFNAKLELAGNMFSLIDKVFKLQKIENGITDKPYSKSILKIPYSQFAKIDLDIRKYFNFNEGKQSLIFRQFIGLGIPYGNSTAMPFVRSYYNGGANDIRAWKAFEGLGPADIQTDEKIRSYMMADIKLTTNIEYRFAMNNMFHGAVFTDMGNIWNLNDDGLGTQFKFKKFIKQMGIGSGFGLRMNIAYVTFRLDLAYKIYDPNRPDGEKWRFSHLQLLKPTYNFAIGYPF